MRFGLCPIQWGHFYIDTLEQSILAEELGFDSIWILEHHGRSEGYYPSPLVALAGIATRTQRVSLGTCVLLLPLYHPVHVAGDGALLDVISGGRLVLGLGLGYRGEEFDAFGVSLKDRASLIEEGVEIISRLWTEDEVSHEGRHYSFSKLSIQPKAVQRPRPPIWLGGWVEQAVRRAARLADAWFPGPTAPFDVLKKCKAIHEDEMARLGKDPSRCEVPITREVYVASDSDSAKRGARRFLGEMYGADYLKWGHLARSDVMGQALTPNGEMDFDKLQRERFIVGSPEECIEIIENLRKELGLTHLVCRTHFPGMNRDEALSSIKLFATEVMAHFKR